MKITSKAQMYRLLAEGAFGNTSPQFGSLEEWGSSPDRGRYTHWGLRSKTPGGPCRLYVPTDEVVAVAGSPEFYGHLVNVSVMLDAIARCTLMADVYHSPDDGGLEVFGVDSPPPRSVWREVMPRGRRYSRLSALGLLKARLNPSSLSDLRELLECYPDHVVEISAYARNVGTIPGRNAVVWEVRSMDGSYERQSWRQPAWEPLRRKPDGD